MNILVVSDNHGLKEEQKEITDRHSVDYMIHCGDSEFKMDEPLLEGFIKVSGNCDTDIRFPNEETLQLGNTKIYITHGHLYNVKMNLLPLSYRAEEEEAQIICYGHTHVAHAEKINNQLFINPGSIRNSKGQLTESYIILDIEDQQTSENSILVKVDFYSVLGELIEGQSDKFSI